MSTTPGAVGDLPSESANANESWNMRLYVAGQTPKSLRALANLKKICEEYLAGKYHIEIIDLLENPQLASIDQILAIQETRPSRAGVTIARYDREFARAVARRARNRVTAAKVD